MNLFLKKLISIISILLVILYLGGYFLEYQFSKNLNDKHIWMLNIKKTYYDNIFLGSSRTLNVTDINYIDSVLQCSSINLGSGGGDFRTLYFVIVSFIEVQDNIASRVIIQVDPAMFYKDSLYNKPRNDHYYLNVNSEEIESLIESDINPIFYKYFPILKYVEYNKVYNASEFYKTFHTKSVFDKTKGSMLIADLNTFNDVQKENNKNKILEFDSHESLYFKKIIDFCKNNKIDIILYTAPIYKYSEFITDHYPNYLSQISITAQRDNLKLYNFGNVHSLEVELFKDKIHMNKKGVALFMPYLVKMINDENKLNIND